MAAPGMASPEVRRLGDLDVLAWPAFDGLGLDAVVTTRHGGVSQGAYASLNLGLHVGDDDKAVLENRGRAAAALGANLGDMVFCQQSHGRAVRVVTAADRGRGTLSLADAIDSTDALVTTEPGIVLVVMVADCVPIVLHDPVAHVLACVHAGWRGTVARVSEAAVDVMSTLGANPADVIACLGPAIAPDRYQVGADVAEAARAVLWLAGGGGLATRRNGPVAVRPVDGQPDRAAPGRPARRERPRRRRANRRRWRRPVLQRS